jgi:hypothetical protein
VASKLYTHALGRTPGEHDAAVLNKLAASFAAAGNRFDQLMLELVASEGFRFVEPFSP